MRPRIGLLTIGQAPRADVVSDLASILGPNVEFEERGALDGLSNKAIAELKPAGGDFPLITRLANGSAVVVGKRKIVPLLQRQVVALEKREVRLLALLCTDDFPEIESRKILLQPYRLLRKAVRSFGINGKKGKIAVLAPLQEQKEAIRKKWQETGLEVIVEELNPYRRSSEAERVIKILKSKNIDLIVLDCLGYSLKLGDEIGRITGKPVLSPRSLLAEAITKSI